MYKFILIISLILSSFIFNNQPNPNGNPQGDGNGLNNPNNPNSDKPVPISGIEFLIAAGIIFGGYQLYKKKKSNNVQ